MRHFLISKRSLRILKRLAIILAISALLLEGFFRYVLFGDDPLARRLGAAMPTLRRPERYAYSSSPEYWVLQYHLNSGRGKEAYYDPLLGWRNHRVEDGTYRYLEREARDGRRPVLLFGDSFANCLTSDADCWQGLLARSDLSDRFVLLNFGTGGYGLGQISLLCKRSLEAYEGQDPLVVVSLLVDDDLDRTVLGFRAWPKPRFSMDAEGHAQASEGPIPRTRKEYLETEGIGISSYALRYLVFGTSLGSYLFSSWKESYRLDHERSVRALTRALLTDLVSHLRSSGFEFTFLLFHGRSFLRDGSRHLWRDELVTRELDLLGVPMLHSRVDLREDLEQSEHAPQDYFIPRGNKGAGHYSALGNEVVFRALHGWILEASR